MTVDPVANFGKVIVSLPYNNTATSIVLQSGNGSKFPDPSVSGAFNLIWWNFTDYPDPSDDPYVEIVRCTAISSDTLTITRAQEGTLASNKNTTGKTYKMVLSSTKKMINDLDVVSGTLSVGGVLFVNSSSKIIQDNLNIFWDNTNKNLGMGTTVPFAGLSSRHGLDIVGSGTYQSLMLNNAGTGGNAWELISANNSDTNIGGKLAFISNNTVLGVLTSDGKLGIGTTNPKTNLEIDKAGSSTLAGSNQQLVVNDTSTLAANNGGGIAFDAIYSGTTETSLAIIRGAKENATDGNTAGYLQFSTRNNVTGFAERVRIDSSGNVGIGTTSPAFSLHTVSTGNVAGRFDSANTTGLGYGSTIRLQNTNSTVNNTTGVMGYNSNGSAISGIEFVNINHGGSGSRQGALSLFTINTGDVVSRLYMDQTGNIGIGSTNVVTPFPGNKISIADDSNSSLSIYESGGNGAIMRLWGFGGTNALPTQTLANTVLGAIRCGGYQQITNAITAAGISQINFFASENFTSTAQGTYITFNTTPNGSTTPAERLRIDNAGHIGIGTTSPSDILDVAYTSPSVDAGLTIEGGNSTANIKLKNTGTGGRTFWVYTSSNTSSIGGGKFSIYDASILTDRLTIDSSGYVGIGSSNPTNPLTVKLDTTTLAQIRSVTSNATYSPAIGLIQSGVAAWDIRMPTTSGDFNINDSTASYPGTTRFTIQRSTGNVGIGTTNPISFLEVSGSSSSPNAEIHLTNYGVHSKFVGKRADGTSISPTAVQANDPIAYFQANPYGSTGFASAFRALMGMFASENMSDTAQGTYIGFYTTPNGTTSPSERLRIDNAGNVGIGTTTITDKLTITGNMAVSGQYSSVKYTTTISLNWNNGNVQYIVLANGAQTFTFANPKDGGRYILIVKQPTSGAAGTVTWPATVAWSGGTAPTLTTTNVKVDIVTFVYDGTNTKYYGAASLNY